MASSMSDSAHVGATRLVTPGLAWAAGRDAGNRSMRAAGRTVWNADDYDAAQETYERLAREGGFWVDEEANNPRSLDRFFALQALDHGARESGRQGGS